MKVEPLDTGNPFEFRARITIDYDDLAPCARLWPEGRVRELVDGMFRESIAESAARAADIAFERLVFGE